MTKYSGTKWNTDECGRCGKPHHNYSGKFDRFGIEYVVCGITHKRMNVNQTTVRDVFYATNWYIDGDKND